jgi:hypothetical protein|tara:strand:- start:2815 stop:3042 length:228 start_codon:yes stop_codon:yes gene_type:complete
MSKPISNAQYRRNVISMPREKQIESVERMLRVIPHWLMEEAARKVQNPKVIKHLESRLRQARLMMSSIIANGRVV